MNTVINTTDEQEAKEEATPTIAASEEDKSKREAPYALPLTVEPNHMEETSMANEETPTKEQMNSDKDQTAAVHEPVERKDPPDPIETITGRPRWERRRPSYLRDYVEK